MRTAIVLAALTIGLLAAGEAAAQGAGAGGVGAPLSNLGQTDPENSMNRMNIQGLLRPDIDTPEGFRTYSRMLVMGRCLAGIGRGAATSALDQPLNSPKERTQVAMLQQRMASCMVAGMPNYISIHRGILSEGLYHKLGDKEVAALSPDAIGRFTEAQRERFGSLDASDRGLALVTDCVVVRRPMLARQVLLAPHGTAAESSAMDALFAASPDCSAGGRPSGISRPFMRAFVANSAWRLARWQAESKDKS